MTSRRSTIDQSLLERTILIELQREHKHVSKTHKVRLRPLNIMLFDSEKFWGQFDAQARTIFIARKLVREHSWQKVMGVFRHEMAHQLVAESSSSTSRPPTADKPHGDEFKEACRSLGVPAQYAKAEIDLQNCNLDWRIDTHNDETEKILDRAKKLLALASSENEHEAHSAMARARELYAKYNLEQTEKLSRESFVHLVITQGKKRSAAWEQRIVSLLMEHFFVQVLLLQQFDAILGQHVQAIELIGVRENVLMAEYVYYFLLQQMESLLKQAIAKGRPIRGREKKSFRLGVLEGFAKKLTDSANPKFSSSDQPTRTLNVNTLAVVSHALSQFKNDTRLNDYLSEIYPRLGSRRLGSWAIDDHAFGAGHTAGQSLNLQKPIVSQTANQGRVLTGR